MQRKIYVSTAGKDTDEGFKLSPVATLQRAVDMASENKREDEVEILLDGGTYFIDKPIEITGQMPKTVIRPAGADAVKINGARRINGFEKSAYGEVECWKAEIPWLDNDNMFASLFVNGKRRFRPRLPKKGFYFMKDLLGKNKDLNLYEGNNAFYAQEGSINRDWKSLEDITVVVMHYWIEERMPIRTYDPDTGLVTSDYTSTFSLIDDNSGKYAKYYLENVCEALSDSGEWYLDKAEKTLYYIPEDGEDIGTAEVYAPIVTRFLTVNGDAANGKYIENILVENITFECSEAKIRKITYERFKSEDKLYASDPQAACGVPGVIHFESAKNCSVTGCNILHTGWYGIEIGEGCSDISITRNSLEDLGAGGIKIGGAPYGGKDCLHTHHIKVTDNRICGGGRFFHSACGILILHGAYNTVAHNDISDLYYTGISCGWVWGYADNYSKENIIENNHIYNIGQGVLSDMGGIYTLGIQPGTVIRGNLIHDIEKWNYGGWAIYPDEGSSHIVIENNVCFNTSSSPFHQHYGRENIVRNNIFALGKEGQIAYTRFEAHRGVTFERNIIISDGQKMFAFDPRNKTIKTDLNLYYDISGKYIFANTDGNDLSFDDVKALGRDARSVLGDPLIGDIVNFDFKFDENSPALAIGFEPFDISRAGIRKNKK